MSTKDPSQNPPEESNVSLLKKDFEWGFDGQNYITLLPTTRQIQQANMMGSQGYANALRSGVMTREELRRAAIERGLLTDHKDSQDHLAGFRNSVTEFAEALAKPGLTDEEREEYAAKIREAKGKAYEEMVRIEDMLSRSAESLADEIRHASLVAKCTFCVDENKARKQVWKDYDAMVDDTNFDLAVEASTKLLQLQSGNAPGIAGSQIETLISLLGQTGQELTENEIDGIDDLVDRAVKDREDHPVTEDNGGGESAPDTSGSQDSVAGNPDG